MKSLREIEAAFVSEIYIDQCYVGSQLLELDRSASAFVDATPTTRAPWCSSSRLAESRNSGLSSTMTTRIGLAGDSTAPLWPQTRPAGIPASIHVHVSSGTGSLDCPPGGPSGPRGIFTTSDVPSPRRLAMAI